MINQERIVERFIKLVGFDSESGNEKSIGEYLQQELTELGLEVRKDLVGNIYGILKGNSDKDAILFSAHQDTVSPGKGKKAIIHADGIITSDGTTVLGSDDISGLVGILEMLASIKVDGADHGDIEVLFSVSEEKFCEGIKKFDFDIIKSKKAYVLDLSGSIGRAAVAAPSILTLNITVNGRSAHSGFNPEQGIHAIKIAADAISQIKNGRMDKETTINFGIIKGGIAPNIVPDKVEIQGEIRSMNHEKAQNFSEKIVEVFREAAERAGGNIDAEVIVNIKSYRTDERSLVVEAYKQACSELEIPVEIVDTFGGSDNNVFAEKGIEGIVISCGMNDVHSVNEFTTIDQLVDSSRVVLKLATQ